MKVKITRRLTGEFASLAGATTNLPDGLGQRLIDIGVAKKVTDDEPAPEDEPEEPERKGRQHRK